MNRAPSTRFLRNAHSRWCAPKLSCGIKTELRSRTDKGMAAPSPTISAGKLCPGPPHEMEEGVMQCQAINRARIVRFCSVLALTVPAVFAPGLAKAAQAPPCHPANSEDISGRGDIVNLPP